MAKEAALSPQRIMADIRHALRQLAKNRGFALIALLTLALGIGATTGIFSILYAYILRPLPLQEPEQLVLFWRAVAANPKEPAFFFNWRDYVWFEERSHAFQSLGASFERAYTLTASGEPTSLFGGIASRTLFSTLGVTAFRGRLFLEADKTGPPVAVISHALWATRFHQSLSALGETLTLNDTPFKVIGVLPPGFSYRVLDQPHDVDVWTLIQSGDPAYKHDSVAAVAIVGRLRPGVPLRQAASEIALLQEENDRRYPDVPKSITLLSELQQDNTRTVRASLYVLSGAVALLLLIACTNTASLCAGRNIQREKEFAIRTALGSGPGRLLVQLLVESLVLYGISGVLGLAIAFGAVRGFLVWNPFGALPVQGIAVNLPVLSLAAGWTLLAGLLFGAWPAWNALRLDVSHALRATSSGTSASADKLRARNLIVLTQIALSVVLLIGASLMLTTFLRLNSEPLGFNPADTRVVTLSLPHRHYASEARLTQLADRLSERLRALPGVEAAGMTLYLSLTEAGTEPFVIEGTGETNSDRLPRAVPVTIGPGYLQAMGVSMLDGRDVTESDQKNAPPVVLMNEEAAKRYFGDKSPIGRHIRLGDPKDTQTETHPWLEVVGVVASTKSTRYNQITWQTRAEVYTDYRQQQTQLYSENSDYTTMFFVIRTRPGVAVNTADLQRAVWSEDRDLPVGRVQSLGEMVSALESQPRLRARLLGLFAGLTLLLAAIGIYGVMAQSVAERHREIGVRIALGADRTDVLLLILRRGFGLTISGVLLGSGVGILAVRSMKSLLYGVAPSNPWVYLLVAGLVSLTALLATFVPARRAASVDPIGALRAD